MLGQLDTLHTAIIQKHEADFVVSYKEHMIKVQVELADFKKRSSNYYLNMKKSEKIRMLENSIAFFREECIKMAASIDQLKVKNKTTSEQLRFANSEITAWQNEAKTLKF